MRLGPTNRNIINSGYTSCQSTCIYYRCPLKQCFFFSILLDVFVIYKPTFPSQWLFLSVSLPLDEPFLSALRNSLFLSPRLRGCVINLVFRMSIGGVGDCLRPWLEHQHKSINHSIKSVRHFLLQTKQYVYRQQVDHTFVLTFHPLNPKSMGFFHHYIVFLEDMSKIHKKTTSRMNTHADYG